MHLLRFLLYSQCSWLCIARSNDTALNVTSASSSHNGTAVATSAAASTSSVSAASSTSPATSSTTPAPTADADILTIAPRRIDFIIAQQSDAQSLPAWLSTLGPDGKWPDSEVDYTTGCAAQRANWPAGDHWVRLAALAAAWHGGFAGASPAYVQSAALRAQIGAAMDWWFARDFGVDSCLDTGGTGACPCGTPGLWNTNWFSNVIGIPRLVGQACLLLNTTLTPAQLANCTHITARAFGVFQRAPRPGFLAGANALDIASIGIARGVLMRNGAVVEDAYGRVHEEVRVKAGFQVDGILEDGSFGQHRGLLYNGNYGKDYTNDVLELELDAGGTRFAAAGASRAAFEKLMDAARWMVYRNTATGVLHWDFSTEGRFISFPVADAQATAGLNINLTEIQQLATLWGSAVLQSVYDDLTAPTGSGPYGNRYFWNNDYMVTRSPTSITTLKMYSTRTRNTECTNLQNPLGFHLSDGALYTYADGAEYEDIAAAWDWEMVPGTTVDYGGTKLACGTAKQVGVEKFVGGVSTGAVGAAVMRYTNPLTGAFSFQKAWFFFAGDVHHIAVSVLNATSTNTVRSVLDQRTLAPPLVVDGRPLSLPAAGANFTFARPHTLFHGATGYLLHGTPLAITAGPRTGDWSTLGTSRQPPARVDLFAAWVPHPGPGPYDINPSLGRAVEYTVFPGRTRAEFERDVGEVGDGLRTLRADNQVTAVHDARGAGGGTTMAVFWRAEGGSVYVPGWGAGCGERGGAGVTVTADSALVLVLERRVAPWRVTVAAPTQELEGARLMFEFEWEGAGAEWWGRGREGESVEVEVEFPAGAMAGASVSIVLPLS